MSFEDWLNNTPDTIGEPLILKLKEALQVAYEAGSREIDPYKIVQAMADIDFKNGDSLCIKIGGDGDNGNYLIELMEQAIRRGIK